ncbi:MAG: phosphomannomutase/phosphoglucomutase [Patescibacteria group bacterium]
MPTLKRSMFREYDIRGLVNEDELNEASITAIARGFGAILREKGVCSLVAGYDNRAYSKALTEAAISGFLASGIDVTAIGQGTAPLIYWAQYHFDIPGVCVGSASHNPNGWFGLKLGYEKSSTLYGEEMTALYDRIRDEKFIDGAGTRRDVPTDTVIAAYDADLVRRAQLHRPLKIVVNCGNGTAGPVNVPALRAFGCEVIEQHTNPDATFPNHEPNPSSVGFQKALEAKVLEVGADCGVGFDADGDRLGIVDNLGRTMYPDKILIFLSRLELAKHPGASIVFDVKSSRAVSDDVKAHGGVPVLWKTGHSYIKAKSREVDAPVSGERSGHIFIRSGYYGYDDALFASLKFLEYVSSQLKTVAELHDEVTTYVTSPTYQTHCADEVKYAVSDKLTAALKTKYGAENVIDINGARVEFEDGWGLVRASSNLPVLVLVFEGKTKERMDQIIAEFKDLLKGYPEVGEMEAE